MAEGGSDCSQDLANLTIVEDVAQEENKICRRPTNPSEVANVVETVQTAMSLYSPDIPSTSIQGKQNQVFNTCTFNVTVNQGETGTVLDRNKKKQNASKSISTPKGLDNLRFEQFERELCVLFGGYSDGVFLHLSKQFSFTSDETKAVLEPLNEWRFVRLLREKGVINCTNIDQLTTAIAGQFDDRNFDDSFVRFEMEILHGKVKSLFNLLSLGCTIHDITELRTSLRKARQKLLEDVCEFPASPEGPKKKQLEDELPSPHGEPQQEEFEDDYEFPATAGEAQQQELKGVNKFSVSAEMIQHLVEGLKSQYEHRFFKVCLLPYRPEKWKSVNEIFVAPNIERLNRGSSPNHPKAWKKVSLYHQIISLNTEHLRTVVHSDPGYGKSLLLQQFAYDWCTSSPDSPLQYVTIFILLRLREFQGMKSIYDAIRTLLPAESILTSSDIKDILTKGEVYVTFAFDGFDEYINANVEDSDITKIIKGEMFPWFGVVVTTRSACLQHLQSTPVTQFRIFGFNHSMQETYIERVIGEKPNDRIIPCQRSIMSRMQESDILRELCQVPFFFALYAQISLDNLTESRYDSVTGYFSHMLACIFSHMQGKLKREIKSPREMGEENLQHRLSLGKVAYNGLVHKTPQLSWSEEEMLNELDSPCYELYMNAGILLKEYEQVFVRHPGSHLDDHLTKRTIVSFLHTTVQEYYAAVYIAHMLKDVSESDFVEVLKRIDCNNSHYVFRFICGLDPLAAKLVLDFLRDLGDDADIYATLCVLEQGGDGIEDVIAELCKKQIVFFFGESKLLQRSKILLLQLASKRKIPIFSVCLFHCLLTSHCEDVHKEFDSLDFYTGLSLPILDTMKMLMIDEIVPLISRTEGILHYATKCRGLETLIFNLALLPRYVGNKKILGSLRMQRCDVQWFFMGYCWTLNYEIGVWTDEKGRIMRCYDYRGKQGYIQFTSLEQEETKRRTRGHVEFAGEYVCGVYYQTVHEPGKHGKDANDSNVCTYESEGKDLQLFGSEGEFLFKKIKRVPLPTKQWHEIHQIYKEMHREDDEHESEGPEI